MTGYNLSRHFWDYSFENPDKIKPNHIAVYFFAVEQCNRLGWKKKFGLPSSMVMEATSIKSYNSYIKVLNDLIDFGFIKLIEKSKNQFTCNVIALSDFDKALDKALDKAIINQDRTQDQSTDSIDKPITINNKPTNHKHPVHAKEDNDREDTDEQATLHTPKIEKEKSAAKKEKDETTDITQVEIFDEICSFFSQTTEVLRMKIAQDIQKIKKNRKLNNFVQQTTAYMQYKKKTQEKVHRWQNYKSIWENENWIDKLKNENSNTTGNGKASNNSKSFQDHRISGRENRLTVERFSRFTKNPFDLD